MNMHTFKHIWVISASLCLSACGGGGDNSNGGGTETGTLNIAITDAPVDGIAEVWVQFSAVTLKPEDGEQLYFELETPMDINLKALTNGKVEILLDEDIPVGNYVWTKLDVNAEFDNIFDSYVVEDEGGQIELRIPSDRLKLGNEFTVLQGGTTAFVIDWNLRMGLTNPVGQPGYKLKPSLRVTDMSEYGTIEGTVDTNLLPPINTDCTSDEETGEGNVVYIYEGFDVIPDDIDDIAPDPLTTANVALNIDSGFQEYSIPFLAAGNYTVAFTCQASDDIVPDPDNGGLETDNDLIFTPGINATVTNGDVTLVPFEAPTEEPAP